MADKKLVSTAMFGLDDVEVLDQARTLAPELFAALYVCQAKKPVFPLANQEELATFVFDAADEVKGPGVRITPELFYKYLPREFYPIHDRADLLRKAYMGIVASHSDGLAEALRGFVEKMTPPQAQGLMAYAGACGVPQAAQVGHRVLARSGEWTRVLYASLVAGKYDASFSERGIDLQWRRYSSLTPLFSSGTHNTDRPYGGIVAYEPYVDYWFKPEKDLTVYWTGRAPRV